jgi:hypothetical protein
LVKKIIIVKNATGYTWDWYCHLGANVLKQYHGELPQEYTAVILPFFF